MAGKQQTISEIEARVKDGLRIARESIEDAELLKLLDDLEYTWENLCSNLIIVSVGLSAMKYRTPEQIKDQLTDYLRMIQRGKEQVAKLFVSGGNDLEN